MKYEVKFTNQFKKDLKLAKKQNNTFLNLQLLLIKGLVCGCFKLGPRDF